MVYAVVSKTTGCNDHVGSSPSPPTKERSQKPLIVMIMCASGTSPSPGTNHFVTTPKPKRTPEGARLIEKLQNILDSRSSTVIYWWCSCI